MIELLRTLGMHMHGRIDTPLTDHLIALLAAICCPLLLVFLLLRADASNTSLPIDAGAHAALDLVWIPAHHALPRQRMSTHSDKETSTHAIVEQQPPPSPAPQLQAASIPIRAAMEVTESARPEVSEAAPWEPGAGLLEIASLGLPARDEGSVYDPSQPQRTASPAAAKLREAAADKTENATLDLLWLAEHPPVLPPLDVRPAQSSVILAVTVDSGGLPVEVALADGGATTDVALALLDMVRFWQFVPAHSSATTTQGSLIIRVMIDADNEGPRLLVEQLDRPDDAVEAPQRERDGSRLAHGRLLGVTANHPPAASPAPRSTTP